MVGVTFIGILLYFKLARVVMGNLSKKGEKYEKYTYKTQKRKKNYQDLDPIFAL